MAQVLIDGFEYPTDVAMQLAYVTSSPPGYSTDLTATMTANNAPSPNVVSASTEYSTYYAYKAFDKLTSAWPTGYYYSYPEATPWIKYDFGAGNTHVATKYTINPSFAGQVSYIPTAWKFYGSNNDSDWTELDSRSGISMNPETVYSYEFSNSTAYRYYLWSISAVSGDRPIIKELTIHKTLASALLAYSESTIKTTGNYALKGIASTESLSDTLTHTFSPALNLTDISTVRLSMRSNRTGANIKFGFVDSDATTEFTPTINSADTWEEKEFDFSAIANANKNAITSLVITVMNADSENTFYLDNLYYVSYSPDYIGVRSSRREGDN